MANLAAELLPGVLRGIAGGTVQGQTQNHSAATYCSLIARDDGHIDWNHSAVDIEARIRAFNPWPLCWTMHGGLELFMLKAAVLENAGETCVSPGQVLGKDRDKGILIQTGKGILAVSELQYRAKKALEWKAFLNGARDFIGARLGTAGCMDK
jgi:methionyl-tRNA formyltransferase